MGWARRYLTRGHKRDRLSDLGTILASALERLNSLAGLPENTWGRGWQSDLAGILRGVGASECVRALRGDRLGRLYYAGCGLCVFGVILKSGSQSLCVQGLADWGGSTMRVCGRWDHGEGSRREEARRRLYYAGLRAIGPERRSERRGWPVDSEVSWCGISSGGALGECGASGCAIPGLWRGGRVRALRTRGCDRLRRLYYAGLRG